MPADKICYNGSISTLDEAGIGLPALFAAPYIYQQLHTTAHRALHLETHLEILYNAFRAVYPYAAQPALDAEMLQERIATLLAANRYPKQGNSVTLMLYPKGLCGESAPAWLLETTAPLLYPDYTVWHKRLMLDIFPCEYLYMGYPTSVSRQIAAYGDTVVRRCGAEAAVVENIDGVLTNIGDEPLFVVSEREVLTSPLSCGATDSVMRRLILEACRKEKITCREEPLSRELLDRCDEAFAGSVQGLISIDGYGRNRYFNLTANRLIGSIR